MDRGLLKRGFDFTRRKKWIVVLGLVGFSSYGVYRVYHMPSVARKRRRMVKVIESILSIVEVVSDSADTLTIVSRDLNEFLKSNSDEIPNSLKQLSKIARSEEFSVSVSRACQAMTVGVLRGYKVESSKDKVQEGDDTNFSDKVMDKLMSTAGTGFVSVVVGSFAKNLVMGFYEGSGGGPSENGSLGGSYIKSNSSTLPKWLPVVSDDKCRVLVADCIKNFVSTAVAVYLDKTMDVNFYDEIFSGLTNPKHQDKMIDVLSSLCNGAVETLVKTSHQVLTSTKQGFKMGSTNSFSHVDQGEGSSFEETMDFKPEASKNTEANGHNDLQSSGWVNTVSSTLAVPSNRKFVLDLTGRVTFETVRSVIEFFLWKMFEFLKRSLNVVHNEVVGRGFEVVRYAGAKSSVILTMCLALFLHITGNSEVPLLA